MTNQKLQTSKREKIKEKKCWWIFFHDWVWKNEWGISMQQWKCKKCGKLKITYQ